ncbi:MAG TPA: lipid II flippase MurJ [Agriterribacter sp.]|nr:lipid II flippase MurJ [Agriterribacter sp.]
MAVLKTESYKKGIVYSTLLNVVSKGLVFGNSLVIAFYFGTQLKTDIYFYTYNTIVIAAAFITSLNASVLIPESMRIRVKEGEEKAKGFLNLFIYGYIALTLIITLCFLIDPVGIFHGVSGFTLSDIQDQKTILLLGAPLMVMMPLINLLTDIMASYKYFTMPMIAGIINGVFSIVFVVLFHGVLDIYSLLIGLLSSYSINLLMLLLLMLKNLSWNFRSVNKHVERRIWKNIGFAQAGNITSSLAQYAPLYLLSGFNAGIITSLNFAQQISSLPTHLITNQFSSVTGIKFNEQYARGDYHELNRTFVSTSGFLLFILFPISGIMFLFSKEIVSILLERGAFGEKGVSETALFLKYLGFLAPLLAINTLFSRLFMAAHKIIESFWYQIFFNLGLILTLYFAVKGFGVVGYPMTVVSLYTLNVIVSYFLEKRYFNIIDYKKILTSFSKVIILNICVIIGMLLVKMWLGNYWVSDFLMLGFGTVIYGSVVLVLGYKFCIDETFSSFVGRYWSKIFRRW